MPEKDISVAAYHELSGWINRNGGVWYESFGDGIVGSGVHKVNNEPVVTVGMRCDVPPRIQYRLLVSDRMAEALEADGVVSFEKPTEADNPSGS